MGKITITAEELKALIKSAVREELADFFFKNEALGLINQSSKLPKVNKKIEDLDISTRLYTFLRKHKILTLHDMIRLDINTFWAMRGKTKKIWIELEEFIADELEEKDS
jgi:DNA-directed RNA polymerase alpha subunit